MPRGGHRKDSQDRRTPPSGSIPRRDGGEEGPLAAHECGADDAGEGYAHMDQAPSGVIAAPVGGLSAKVLVLNRAYAAMRVVSAHRAFCLLVRNVAEVISVEQPDGAEGGAVLADGTAQGQYISYDFASWLEVSQLQRELEPHRHDWVRTVRMEIAVPKIIRLLGYDRLPAQGVKLNRRNLFARDRNRCQYCGRTFPTSDLSIDHVTPRSLGGGDSWENLVCACVRCNARKGGRTPDQAGMKLITRPARPKRNPLISLRMGNAKYSSWKTFLDNAYWSVELG